MGSEEIGKNIEKSLNALSNYRMKLSFASGSSQDIVKAANKEENRLKSLIKKACEEKLQMSIKVIGKNKCSLCNTFCETKQAICEHYMCKQCVKGIISKETNGKFDKRAYDVKCPKCQIPLIDVTRWISLVELKEENRKATSVEIKFQCPFCLEDVLVGKVVKEKDTSLPCGHFYHVEHLKEFLEKKIASANVTAEALSCPIAECKKRIPESIIKGTVSTEIYDKMIRFQLRMTIQWGDKETYKPCPSCDIGTIISTSAEEFECDNLICKEKGIKICPNCNAKPPHKGKTCNDYLREKNDLKSEAEFNAWMKSQGAICCPACKTPTIKTDGCNVMHCLSPVCKNKGIYFCYLCGKQGTTALHQTHFTKDGYFGISCNTKDHLPG